MASPLKTIREMIGRLTQQDQDNLLNSIRFTWNKDLHSKKLEQTDYDLTRAVYYGSTLRSDDGVTKGEEYLLGSVFARKIINSLVGFAFSQPLQVTFTDSSEADIEQAQAFIKDWLNDNSKSVSRLIKNCFRDGDSYIKITDGLDAVTIQPSRIKYKLDPVTGEITGITDSVKIQENNEVYIYETEYTKTYPFEVTYKYKAGSPQSKTLYRSNSGFEDDNGKLQQGFTTDIIKPIPIIGFHNDKEDGYAYGITELQNVFFLMANYHAVLYEAVKGNIFNSQVTPYITGVKDKDQFMRDNGISNDDGTYSLKFDKGDVWIGEEGFDIKMISTTTNASDAEKILNILFWLICQASETPEFIMGTAVASSKASVSEQLPIMLKKAELKRTEMLEYFQDLIQLVINKAITFGFLNVSPNIKFNIQYAPMIDEDKKLNLEILTALSAEGVITDETKLKLMNLPVIDNIKQEIIDARAENADKSKDYNTGNQDQLRINEELKLLDNQDNINN